MNNKEARSLEETNQFNDALTDETFICCSIKGEQMIYILIGLAVRRRLCKKSVDGSLSFENLLNCMMLQDMRLFDVREDQVK